MSINKDSMVKALTVAIEAAKSIEEMHGVRLLQNEVVKLALTVMIQDGRDNGFNGVKGNGSGNGKDLETQSLRLSFGKYRGLTILDVIKKTGDTGYILWLSQNAKSQRLRAESAKVLENQSLLPETVTAEVAN